MDRISVVIPHAGGEAILGECLGRLAQTRDIEIELIIVVNGTTEKIPQTVVSQFRNPQVLEFPDRIGFAAACNRGIDASACELGILLNNDAVVNPNTLKILTDAMISAPNAAACQPKLLSSREDGKFDYSSAAGGEIDRFGFPFAHGRVFDTVEVDSGQYNLDAKVFWAAGAALMVRREVYLKAGGLEERFFAHMEEIDLCWRFHLMGYNVLTVTAAIVYHAGAMTIKEDSSLKIYLNHRNSQAMLFRCYGTFSLLKYMPIRELLDLTLIFRSIILFDFKRILAVLRAKCWIWYSLHYLIISRRNVQRLRTVNEQAILNLIYPRSVVWDYFILKLRTWDKLQVSWKRHLR
ncbi:glycosyltransferase family 2 protein [Calditrichota bacterium]